ncbi:MAG: HAD-IA family hydrolase [Anaerolineaceae bacterium]|nr:HAD-IA family hydrolase [Anaerolineaceae bacterium]
MARKMKINPYEAAGISFPTAALWDMDGVICDNGEIHFQGWLTAMANHPEIPFSREIFNQTFGMNNHGALEVLLHRAPTDEEVEEIAGLKERRFRELLMGNAQYLPGVEHLLAGFRQAGVKQAIGSSAPKENIDILRRELSLDRYLDVFVSAEAMRSKPDPAVFLAASRQLEVDPANCVVFEDAVAGVRAGLDAGCQVIAVTTTNPRDLLSRATLVVDRLDEIDFDSWLASPR